MNVSLASPTTCGSVTAGSNETVISGLQKVGVVVMSCSAAEWALAGSMTAPGYRAVTAIDNRVTAVTYRTIGGSPPAPWRARCWTESGTALRKFPLRPALRRCQALTMVDDARASRGGDDRIVPAAAKLIPQASLQVWF